MLTYHLADYEIHSFKDRRILDQLAEEIGAMVEYQLDGVCLDFENIILFNNMKLVSNLDMDLIWGKEIVHYFFDKITLHTSYRDVVEKMKFSNLEPSMQKEVDFIFSTYIEKI